LYTQELYLHDDHLHTLNSNEHLNIDQVNLTIMRVPVGLAFI
jgi:hypothetical protein